MPTSQTFTPLNMAEVDAEREDLERERDEEGRDHVRRALSDRLADGGLDVPPGGEP